MGSDNEIPTWQEALAEAGQNLSLGLFDEVGEGQVAAEDQVEGAFGHVLSEVLKDKLDVFTVWISKL